MQTGTLIRNTELICQGAVDGAGAPPSWLLVQTWEYELGTAAFLGAAEVGDAYVAARSRLAAPRP